MDIVGNIDKTINAICDRIQKETKSDSVVIGEAVPEMTKALAELVSARAQIS